MRYRAFISGTLGLLLFAAPARGQSSFKPEVFASIAYGHVFRFGDGGIGGGLNLGGGIGLRHNSGLGAEFEVNRTLGLTAKPAPCGIVGVVCEGSAREGVTSATILPGNVSYEAGRDRMRPYVTGGVGVLNSAGYSATLLVSQQRAVFSEQRWRDTGLAVNVGGGFRIQLTGSLWLRPELRLYHGGALSGSNLSLFRLCTALGWSH